MKTDSRTDIPLGSDTASPLLCQRIDAPIHAAASARKGASICTKRAFLTQVRGLIFITAIAVSTHRCSAATVEPSDPDAARIQYEMALVQRQTMRNDMAQAQTEFARKKAQQDDAILAMRSLQPPAGRASPTSGPIPSGTAADASREQERARSDPQRSTALMCFAGLITLFGAAVGLAVVLTNRVNAKREAENAKRVGSIPYLTPAAPPPPLPPPSLLKSIRPKAIEVHPADRSNFMRKVESAIEDFKNLNEV